MAQENPTGGATVAEFLKKKRHNPVQDLRTRFEVARKFKQRRSDRWLEIERAYHGYINTKKKGRASFHFHKVFPQIELEAARFIVNYFRTDPFIAAKPTNSSTVEVAQRHERAMQHYLEHCPEFFLSKTRLIKYTGLYGSGFEMPSWRKQVQKIKRQVPVTFGGQQVGVHEIETDQVVYEGLSFRTFGPNEVYPYPFANSIDSSPWLIVLEFVTLDQLMERTEMGVFDKTAVNKIPLNSYFQDQIEFTRRFSNLGYNRPEADKELICLIHSFGPDRFETLANDSVMIRDAKNEFWHRKIPMVQGVKTVDPDNFWPIGTAKNILPNQKMLNLYMNSMVDSTISTLWPIWKHRAHINPNNLLSLPNQRIVVRSMDDVDVIKMPEMKNDLLAIKAMLEANTEEITGYFGTQKGQTSGTKNTATSDTIFQAEGNNRIASDVMTFEQLTLIPEAKMISMLLQQFMPDNVDIRLNGPGGTQFQPMTPADIRGEFQFQASGSSESIHRAVVQQQLIAMFTTAQDATQFVQMPNGAVIPVPVLDTYQALKEIYEGYGRQNTDQLLYRPEVFGIPINNKLLNNMGLPSIPGLDNLSPNPNTGALRTDENQAALQNMGRSVKPSQIINHANRVKPTGIGVM